MSLVRPSDLSATSYSNRRLYVSSTPIFNSDKQRIMYTPESYNSETYDPKYLLDSPTEELLYPTGSDIASTTFHRHNNPFGSGFELESLESPSPDAMDYDEDRMKLKLRELERALLNDDGEDEMSGPDQSMDIDVEWVDPNLQESPKESSSSDSNISSSICSSKESSLSTTRTPMQLLINCATMISDGNTAEASTMMNELRLRVSIQGDPTQRIAAYMVEALAARVATSGKGLYRALKCKEPPSLDRLSAMQVLFEVCPCFRFGFMAANGAIIEAFEGEKTVHIVDFDINQGSQYITLIQTIAKLSGKPPHLRLTGVDDPESVQRSIGGLNLIGQRLEELAEMLNVPFEFRAVASKTSVVTPSMLNRRPGEALIVNFAFQLHHMPDESVSTVNLRDQLLRLVKGLNPKLVTFVEQDVNTNTTPFLPRFKEAYNYYSAVFESLDAALPRDSQERMNVERQCLARDIVNVVACEGEERIERYEVAGKWRARMTMAGFKSCPISPSVSNVIADLIKQYSDRYKLKEESGSLHFGWEDKILIVASAWR